MPRRHKNISFKLLCSLSGLKYAIYIRVLNYANNIVATPKGQKYEIYIVPASKDQNYN